MKRRERSKKTKRETVRYGKTQRETDRGRPRRFLCLKRKDNKIVRAIGSVKLRTDRTFKVQIRKKEEETVVGRRQ